LAGSNTSRDCMDDEELVIREDLQSRDPIAPTTFDITDAFDTENDFHGAEVGLLLEYERCRSMPSTDSGSMRRFDIVIIGVFVLRSA